MYNYEGMLITTGGGKRIGDGCPCFIIAEAGINHNGDIALAKKMIDAASEFGSTIMQRLLHLWFEIMKMHDLKCELLKSNEHTLGFYRKFGFEDIPCPQEIEPDV